MLSPYRVVDLTDHRGQIAGFMLASLGADVIMVEPPDASAARKHPPFAGKTSLSWWAYNRGKRSVVLDRQGPEFSRLVANADVLIDNHPHGCDPAWAEALNPRLIHATISAFGADGPKSNWPASDLTILAAGCSLSVTGNADRPPVRVSIPQAWLHAGAEAAGAVLIALQERYNSGRGQRLDVSAQAAAMMAAVPATFFGPNGAPDVERLSGGVRVGSRALRFVYPAANGFVSIMHNFSSASGPYSAQLMQYARPGL